MSLLGLEGALVDRIGGWNLPLQTVFVNTKRSMKQNFSQDCEC
jgi:hypothetical protein